MVVAKVDGLNTVHIRNP